MASAFAIREAWSLGRRYRDASFCARSVAHGDPVLEEAFRRAYHWSRHAPMPALPPDDLMRQAADWEEDLRRTAEWEDAQGLPRSRPPLE